MHATNKRAERLGKESISKDGFSAKVTEYSTCENFIIEFADGTKKKMKNWKSFEDGNFTYRYMYHPITVPASERLGVRKQMNNGFYAKITAYRNSHDADVEFEDGEIVHGVSWRDFANGIVAHPRIKTYSASSNELTLAFYLEPLGFKKVPQHSVISHSLGLGRKEIDMFSKKLNIAVEYDGELFHGNAAKDIEKDNILSSLGISVYRFRENKCPPISGNIYHLENSNFLSASFEKNLKSFFADVLSQDPSGVDFVRDKDEILHFIAKRKRSQKHTGERGIMSNGMEAEIIEAASARNITVRFEDGAIAYGKTYASFKSGNIPHPDFCSEAKKKQRLGAVRTMRCGLKAAVTEYFTSEDITVRFESGETVKHKRWNNFAKGNIFPPSLYAKNRIGERRLQKRGMYAEIISAKDANHIDVRFDDGTVIKNRKMCDFTKGIIGNPNLPPAWPSKASERIGETRTMRSGLTGTITVYRTANDIDIDFGDGKTAKHRHYANFVKGLVRPDTENIK